MPLRHTLRAEPRVERSRYYLPRWRFHGFWVDVWLVLGVLGLLIAAVVLIIGSLSRAGMN